MVLASGMLLSARHRSRADMLAALALAAGFVAGAASQCNIAVAPTLTEPRPSPVAYLGGSYVDLKGSVAAAVPTGQQAQVCRVRYTTNFGAQGDLSPDDAGDYSTFLTNIPAGSCVARLPAARADPPRRTFTVVNCDAAMSTCGTNSQTVTAQFVTACPPGRGRRGDGNTCEPCVDQIQDGTAVECKNCPPDFIPNDSKTACLDRRPCIVSFPPELITPTDNSNYLSGVGIAIGGTVGGNIPNDANGNPCQALYQAFPRGPDQPTRRQAGGTLIDTNPDGSFSFVAPAQDNGLAVIRLSACDRASGTCSDPAEADVVFTPVCPPGEGVQTANGPCEPCPGGTVSNGTSCVALATGGASRRRRRARRRARLERRL